MRVLCDHHPQKVLLGEVGQPEDFFWLHTQLLPNFIYGFPFIQKLFDNGFHRLQQVCTSGSIVGDGSVDILSGILVVYNYDWYFATQGRKKRLLSADCSAVEAVNDCVVWANHNR